MRKTLWLTVVALAACSGVTTPCSSETCGGCCRGDVCYPGNEASGCGAAASACSDCQQSGQRCGPQGTCIGGSATDDGGSTCAAPLVECAGACVDVQTNAAHCGGCGDSCGAGAVCSAGHCSALPADCTVTPCPAQGYYCDLASKQCKSGCVLDAQCAGQQDHCDTGTRTCVCQPGSCGAGSYCAAGGTCATGCSSGVEARCSGGMSCDLSAHQCSCPAGQHACNGQCTENTRVSSCGAACTPCPAAPANGVATCDGASCGFACNSGYHRCGDQCLANNSVASCGSACTACPATTNGSATCDGTSCGLACSPGYLACQGTCALCPTGAAITACSGASCVATTCTNGLLKCGSGCCSARLVSAGRVYGCALTTTGAVKCWGNNNEGQLGDGTLTRRLTPVDAASGLASTGRRVCAGSNHTCALTTANTLKCWGWNSSGQLGDGTTVNRALPVDVLGLGSGASAVAIGEYHSCAVTGAGGLKCWGSNFSGTLGDGTTVASSTPVDVAGLTAGVAGVAVGRDFSCALTTAGAVQCWGGNHSGQLGDGTTIDRLTPVPVVGLTGGVTAITAGDAHVCALTTAGGLKCWGSLSEGQLGDGTVPGLTFHRATPGDVTGLTSGVASVSAGGSHSCAVTTTGALRCWGSNRNGEIGDGTMARRLTPVTVTGLGSGVATVSAGADHTCALTAAGLLKCWGGNAFGQLGDGTMTNRYTPIDVSGN
ncbi:MAG: hypothetical protein IPJ65_35625 [Archangiaceae bacterium]|nr:hypothetical protein [Archangiaceae bacterium]